MTLAGPALPTQFQEVAAASGHREPAAATRKGSKERRASAEEVRYVPEDGGDEDLEEHFLGDGRPASPARSGFETTRHS